MGDSVKRLAILGSTGSIGRQTLDVVRSFPGRFRVVGLAAGRNAKLLSEQIEEFKPTLASLESPEGRERLPHTSCEIVSIEDIASHPDVDMVVIATSGKAGLSPTLSAIHAAKRVALSNKEVMVMAGEVIVSEARRYNAEILPIDSEHSAIWQCLKGEERGSTSRLILTASGGPFRNRSDEELKSLPPEEALMHPIWRMGEKVTIDSATLMNKGMEVIEAHWLFDMPFENIDVLIHPESIIHSFVEFTDGSVKAQLSPPDMRFFIQYALFYPERPSSELPRLDLTEIGPLTFERPDVERFPCLKLAVEAGKNGGTCPAVLTAADEVAVELFLSKRIGFLDIAKVVEETLSHHQSTPYPSLDDILAADQWAREYALALVQIGNR